MGILRFAFPAPQPRCLSREDWPLRRLPSQFLQRLREVLAVVQEEDPARAPLHEKRDERRVGLCRVAVAAGEDEVVRAVVRILPAPGADVIEGDGLWSRLDSAVGANRAVFSEEPLTMTGVGAAGGPAEGWCGDCCRVRAGVTASSGCSCHKPCLKCRTRSGPSGPPNALLFQLLKVHCRTFPRQSPAPFRPHTSQKLQFQKWCNAIPLLYLQCRWPATAPNYPPHLRTMAQSP